MSVSVSGWSSDEYFILDDDMKSVWLQNLARMNHLSAIVNATGRKWPLKRCMFVCWQQLTDDLICFRVGSNYSYYCSCSSVPQSRCHQNYTRLFISYLTEIHSGPKSEVNVGLLTSLKSPKLICTLLIMRRKKASTVAYIAQITTAIWSWNKL